MNYKVIPVLCECFEFLSVSVTFKLVLVIRRNTDHGLKVASLNNPELSNISP